MRILWFFFCLSLSLSVQAREGFRVVFYNVENFFDCDHDTLKSDQEFLPGGIRGWTPSRFFQKAGHIAKVVAVAGEDRFPEIVAMAEVENDHCLEVLTRVSPLKNAGYSFVHEESPDVRGVDVCLLYDRYRFHLLGHRALPVVFQDESYKKTRDVLYVWGQVAAGDTVHLFVCHFPSRLGGASETDAYRRQEARLIRAAVDSIFVLQPCANILIMGDFNDLPTNKSLSVDLKGLDPRRLSSSPMADSCSMLYNLMLPFGDAPEAGTHKQQGHWGVLDQMLVSGNVLKKKAVAHILEADFLMVQDERWLGRKPFRTYNGMTYQGGYSDHLPIYLDLNF
jgi:hypothetical protein